MLKKDRKSINNKYLTKQVILATVIIIYILSLSFISGRYALKTINTYLTSSKEFYFYSDKLTDENDESYFISWSGLEECIIPISLYTKKNSLKKAEYEIAYEVECVGTEGIECELSKDNGIIDSNEDNTDAFTVLITPKATIEIGDIFEVNVSVTTVDITEDGEKIESFTKTLTRTFEIKVVGSDTTSYKIEDESGRAYLNCIITNNTDKPQIITLTNTNTEGLIIDNTNNIFLNMNNLEIIKDERNYIKTTKFKLDPISNITLKFFKNYKNENYTNSNILKCEFEEIDN